MVTGRARQSTESGRQRVLRPEKGSTETVDHGKLASTLRREVSEQWGREKLRDGAWETAGLEDTMRLSQRPELKPEPHRKHSFPNFHLSSNFYVSF